MACYRAALGHLGTYAADRDAALRELFVEPARRLPDERFIIAGSMYDGSFPWQPNIFLISHLAPADHPAFYCSTRLTLNVTRGAMAEMGYCPSGRLFEAAACGAPVLSDDWEGMEQFFEPGSEILLAHDTEEAMDALDRSPEDLARIARAARERTLARAYRRHSRAGTGDHTGRGARFHTGTWAATRRCGGDLKCGELFQRRAKAAVFSRWRSRRNCCRWAREPGRAGRRPRAVSDYLVERLVIGGATRICFVISPTKSDILEYYGGLAYATPICYCVQPEPLGLCDAIFRALPVIDPREPVLIGLPDTVWFPADGLRALPDDRLSFLLFPVDRPELFDAVICDDDGRVLEIQVKQPDAAYRLDLGSLQNARRGFSFAVRSVAAAPR